MFRTLTRNRTLFAGLAVTLGVAGLGSSYNPAQARTSFGEDRLVRAAALADALDAYTEAAKTCDLDVTREAFEDAESVWNAVEIDIQFPSPERYMFFEHVYLQDRVVVGIGLEGDAPDNCAIRVKMAEEQGETWDEAVDFLTNSTPDSELFNDVATLRTINQGVRRARTAIDGYADAVPQSAMTAPDPAGAKAHWLEFAAEYPVAREIIAFRNEALALEVDGLVVAAAAAFEGEGPFPTASAALAALAPRYNLGATLVTAAARNSLNVRPEFDPDDFYTEDSLGEMLITFGEMRDAIETGTPEGALLTQELYNDWIQVSLSFKTGGPLARADVNLTTAVNNYVAAQTPATAKTLNDQINVAEQIFVGQYWGDPALVEYMSDI